MAKLAIAAHENTFKNITDQLQHINSARDLSSQQPATADLLMVFKKKKDASFEWRMYFNCRPCKVRILIVWTWHDTFCTALRQSQQRLLCMTRMHTNTHKFDQQHFELWARILQSLRHFSVHHRSLVYMFTGCVQTVVVASHPTHLSVTICPPSPTLCMVYSLWLITLLDLRHYPFTTSFTEELGVFTTGRSNVILLKLDIWCCSVL